MLITVKKAGEQWCPQSRVWSSTGGINRDSTAGHAHVTNFPGDAARCLGPKCMAWRWESATHPVRRRAFYAPNTAQVEEPTRPDSLPADWVWCPYVEGEGDEPCWVEPAEQAAARRFGFCGLAGKPTELVVE